MPRIILYKNSSRLPDYFVEGALIGHVTPEINEYLISLANAHAAIKAIEATRETIEQRIIDHLPPGTDYLVDEKGFIVACHRRN